jgi:arylsulfatase
MALRLSPLSSRRKADGVIVAQGGRFAGWSLYVKDGILRCVHNWFDTKYSYVAATDKVPTDKLNLRYHFDFDGSQPGAGGKGTLHINDVIAGDGTISKTVPFVFSADETMDIGGDFALPVTDDYPEGEKNQFQSKIIWVRIDLEDDDVSHLEPAELKYQRTLARQ